ncbi:hypothetical protein LVB77_14550 [Lysobacter sp. 5GHs7-4]|uniref:phage tail tube protein n=1 Tax=Lysobacter sp. 5GHs7-4 TaxID=2904253 RepID=UPI001E2A6409|nr:phage tail tube protein [Lysobacter sp. 5GHs7-4]UHQ21886.1 hypothetical protein LVB77_14550 [Lysobacter sp. 5GHs7-4]
MAKLTKGTVLYVIDPADDSILIVGCATNIDGIDTTLEQVETTCLEDSARTYVAGMATPGAATFTINFDPDDASHVRLHQMKVAGLTLKWAVGIGIGDPPTAVDSNGEFELPGTRPWIEFEGFMNSYPFSFPLAGLVTSNVGIQVSGEPTITPRSNP